MGWMGKAVAILLGLMLLGGGLWPLALLIFAWLLLPPVVRAWRRKPKFQDATKPRGRLHARFVLGGFLFGLAFLGYIAHGSYSPFVFGTLGALAVLWGRLPSSAVGSRLRPVSESVLLRSTRIPFAWAAVAEVKPLTRDLGRALAGLDGTVVLSGSGTPSVHLVVEMRALSVRSAEEGVLAALNEAARYLSGLGAYLLPLDSGQALAVFEPSFEATAIVERDWFNALASANNEVVSIRQAKGFAKAIGLYKRSDSGREGRGAIPSPAKEFAHPPLAIEVFKAMGSRLASPNPDQYTAFLSSLMATSGEPIGTRILEAGPSPESQVLVVRSQASPEVELSRVQVRAVARVYG